MRSVLSLFSLGIDSGLCCLVIGAIIPSYSGRIRLAMTFGLCDTLASLLGPIMGQSSPQASALYLCCAVLLGLAACNRHRLLVALPFLLGLDNLFSFRTSTEAITDGIGSAMLALVGLWVGRIVAVGICRMRRSPGQSPSLINF